MATMPLMDVAGVSEGLLEIVHAERSVGALGELPDGRAGQGGVARLLPGNDVGARSGDGLAAPLHVMGHLRHQIGHRPAGHEQGRLLAQELGGPLLEGDDGRIVAEDVVAHFRLVHGLAHCGRGMSDGVAAKIDHAGSLMAELPPLACRWLVAGAAGR
jgi:hypothetical protein